MLLYKKNIAFMKINSSGILVQFTKCFGGENINKLPKIFIHWLILRLTKKKEKISA